VSAVLQPANRYDEAARERIRRLTWLRANPKELPKLKRYYRTHIADFINDWGLTVDPRNVGTDRPVVLSFLLDPRQREWIEFTFDHWRRRQYAMTVKSRDVGVSWLIVAFSIAIVTLYDDVAIGWGSFKKEKVDWKGDMGSIFEKGRAFFEGLPEEFRGGYDARIHSFERRLFVPKTRGSIIGEIGDNIGRGGRTTIYFVDETAYLEHGEMVDAALSKNTMCRQDVSSVHGMMNTFAQRAHQKSILENGQRFNFHWRDNPRMTQDDYDKFLETWGPVITAQELDMNFQASVEGIVIPAEWLNSCVGAIEKLGLKTEGEIRAALDVSDEGPDRNALAVVHGVTLIGLEQWSGKGSDPYATAEKAFLHCDTYGARRLRYDADGIGSSVRGDARKINETRNPEFRINVEAHRGSGAVLNPLRQMVEGRKNEDFFLNFKAQAWWWLRMCVYNTHRAVKGQKYDPEKLISLDPGLPLLQKLLVELCQPTYSQNQAGKMLIDKQPEGMPSPNLADAVMMAYAPRRGPMRIADSDDEET
jgi:hypothetical protein